MANSNKKFGEAFFAELNDDTYLHSIHQSLLIPLCFLHLEKQSHSNDECFLEYNQKA